MALERLKRFVVENAFDATSARIIRCFGQFGAFYDHALQVLELRIERLGLSESRCEQTRVQ